MPATDIPLTNLLLATILIVIPILMLLEMKVKLIKTVFTSMLRIVIQLAVIGIVLDYLFMWNNLPATIGWMLVMLVSASLITMERLDYPRSFILPLIFIPFFAATVIVLPYMVLIIVRPQVSQLSRYLIPLYGMLLGWKVSGRESCLQNFQSTWDYIDTHLIDSQYGEWFGYLDREGRPTHLLKGGPYKCFFHVPRALLFCIKLLEQLEE